MQTFVAIADGGSLTAAARSLDSSLPAVVRSLAALEAHLGVRLAQRTTRRIALSDEGRRYLENCRQVLAAVEAGETALSADSGEPAGPLTVTAPVAFGQMFVAPAVTRFVRRFPKVQVKLLLFDRVVNLLEEGIDAGVRIGELADSSLVAQAVTSVRRMVVASPGYLRSAGTPRHPRDLLKANCIRFSGSSGPWWSFHEGKRQFSVPVTGNLEFNHVGPSLDACIEGVGLGMFISYQVALALKQKKLVPVLEDFEPPPRPISIVYPHARLLPARTRRFVDWMKGELLALKP
jgi:DNA-binding transcriptional LysR family regulator